MTLKRYQPRKSLRSGTKRRQIESLLERRPDYSRLYEALGKRRQEQLEQQRNEEILKSIETQEALKGKQPGGAVQEAIEQLAPGAEPGEKYGKAAELQEQGLGFWGTIGKAFEAREGLSRGFQETLIGPKGKGYSPVDLAARALEPTAFMKAFRETEKLREPLYSEAGITRGDVLKDILYPDWIPGAPESEAFEKYKEISKAHQVPIELSGLSTTGALRLSPLGRSILDVKKKITGTALISDYSPDTVGEITFDPINIFDLGAWKFLGGPLKVLGKIMSYHGVKAVLSRTQSPKRLFMDLKAAFNPDELSEVLSYKQVRGGGISEDLLPNTIFDADFDMYAKMGLKIPRSATGVSRGTLWDITRRLEENVVDANKWIADNARKFRKKPTEMLVGSTDFKVPYSNKTLNLNEQEDLLTQLNKFWGEDEAVRAAREGVVKGDFDTVASRLNSKGKLLADRPEMTDLFRNRGRGILKEVGDVLIGRRTIPKIPGFLQIFKPMKYITGYRAQRPYYEDMVNLITGKAEGDVGQYLEGLNFYYDAKQRILPQIIERDILKLKRTGSPFKVNEEGLIKVRDNFIDQELMERLGVGKAHYILDADNKVILPVHQFIGKFFTKEAPFWKLTGAETADAARNTPLGKWIETYQNTIKQSIERSVAKGVDVPIAGLSGNIGEYIPAIGKEIDEVAKNPGTYDWLKPRAFTDKQAGEAISEGYIKYHQDPYAMLKIFLTSQENAILTKEFENLVEKAAKARFVKTPAKAMEQRITKYVNDYNDIVGDFEIEPGAILSKTRISRMKRYFPEVISDIDELGNMTGTKYANKLKSIKGKINKLRADPTSDYSQSLKRIRDDDAYYKKNFDEFGIDVEGRRLLFENTKNPKVIKRIKARLGVKGEETSNLIKGLAGFGRGAEKAGNIYRFYGLGFDLGSPLIHGLVPLVTNPKAWSRGVRAMFDNLFDPEMKAWTKYMENNIDILDEMNLRGIPLGAQTSDWLQLFQKGQVYRGPKEPGQMGWVNRHLYKIPKLGDRITRVTSQITPAMERGFAVPIDIMKAEMYKSLKPLAKTGNDLDDIASIIRHSTGAMDMHTMGFGGAQRTIETLLFISPRLLRGVAGLMFDATKLNVQGSIARESIGRMGMAYLLFSHIVSKLTGGETDYDPTSSKFGMVKIGNTWVGANRSVWSVVQAILAGAENALEEPEDLLKLDYWTKGYVLRDPDLADSYRNRVYNEPRKLLLNKKGYLMQIAMQALTGEDYWGQEKNLFAGEGWDVLLPAPIWAKAAIMEDSLKGLRVPDFTIFGEEIDFYWGQLTELVAGRSWVEGPWEQRQTDRDRIAAERFGKGTEWADLSSIQQDAIENPPINFLNQLSEGEREQYKANAKRLQAHNDAYNKSLATTADVPALNLYFMNLRQEQRALNEEIATLTSVYEEGGFRRFPDYRKEIGDLYQTYYVNIEKVEEQFAKDNPGVDLHQTLKENSKVYPEESIEYLYRVYFSRVFDPSFDLPGNEFDWEAYYEADKGFLDEFGQEIYNQVATKKYLRKEQNMWTSEILTGRDIFGGKYWRAVDDQMKTRYPQVYEDYLRYKKMENYQREAWKKTNPALDEFLTTRRDVRRLVRERDPLLDIWTYRMGYEETLVSAPFLDETGKAAPVHLDSFREMKGEWNWSERSMNRKEEYPGFYEDPN